MHKKEKHTQFSVLLKVTFIVKKEHNDKRLKMIFSNFHCSPKYNCVFCVIFYYRAMLTVAIEQLEKRKCRVQDCILICGLISNFSISLEIFLKSTIKLKDTCFWLTHEQN